MNGAALMVGGFAMGLAGSLHCSCVCGGIASSLLLAARPGNSGPVSEIGTLATIQAGRALTYAIGGAVVALAGSSLAGLLHLAGWQPVVRIAAAAIIVAVGLSIAGILPQRHLSIAVRTIYGKLRRAIPPRAAATVPLISGMAWGLAPCGMVYNALLMATVAGSPLKGALFMSGFAIATIPAVSLAAYGSVRAISRGESTLSPRGLKTMLGTSLAALGIVSAVFPAHSFTGLCIPG